MAEIVFADPLGNPFRTPTVEELAELLSERGEDYWNDATGSGHASLYYYTDAWRSDVAPVAVIDMTMRNEVGFHVYYSRQREDGTKIQLFASSGADYTTLTWIQYAGGRRRLPVALFVHREDALEIVQQFFLDGEPTDKVKWVRSRDIPWERLG